MNFLEKIVNIRSLPEKKKKIVFWTLVIIIAFFLFFAWIEDARIRIYQFKEEASSSDNSFMKAIKEITPPNLNENLENK